ncbi:MAG TPA: hypothetical protein VMQ93_10060 [Novosphingobium sp.]|nr:hypothetical protein [Novosphingobium sp.]
MAQHGDGDDRAGHLLGQFHEEAARVVGPGVVDQQADVDVVRHLAHLRQGVGLGEVDGGGAHVRTLAAQLGREILQRSRLAGDEHELEPVGRQKPRELGADAFRSTDDERPWPILVEVHADRPYA